MSMHNEKFYLSLHLMLLKSGIVSIRDITYQEDNAYIKRLKIYMERLKVMILALFTGMCMHASTVERQGRVIIVRPDSGQARVVCLQVMSDGIIRVRSTSDDMLPIKPKSLIIVPQTAAPDYEVTEDAENVRIKAARVQAVVNRKSGRVTFSDADGKTLLRESDHGKKFWAYTVPERDLGMRTGATVTEQQRHGLSWQMVFDSSDDEAFYGLGQHQSEELNMKGRNEDLFQYNTKVAVPFILSNKHYGLLWDSYSYCRFGNPDDYLQLNKAFKLYDKKGHPGHLTGTYVDKNGQKIVREEDSLYYEYAFPQTSEIACRTENGGIKNLPKGFPLDGASVTYEGFIEPTVTSLYQFILYYAGYIKVYLNGEEVVTERWRTAWNPNSYKFDYPLQKGQRVHLRIEWQPDGGESYCGLRVAQPRSEEERGKLSVWSEMAKDMDYYFIAGQNMDEVISGYRTLTGRASLYPKWVLGYWQSRERYKTAGEVEETLAEFRSRHIPIDNIVQDWFYWKEDQWGSHQFDPARYPNPQLMLDSIHQMHGRFMISVWPKFYKDTDHFKELDAKGWMYKQAVHDDIHDWVGHGYVGGFYDAYSDEARKVFWRQMDENLYTGLAMKGSNSRRPLLSHKLTTLVDAWWMDASEPNVRDCTPMWYRKALCGPTALGTSTEFFNAYSIVNADAIYNGQRSVWKGKRDEPRVFLLTRSGFAGEQRYSTATWSGDIGTRWEDMRAQMTAGLNFSMSGIPFWGMDQGGFCVEKRYVKAQQLFDKTGEENEDLREWRELQCRWNQFGAFVPIFRSHGQWPLREIWNIVPKEHKAYLSFVFYDRLRYHLMPYLYSLSAWTHFKDYTMMRALVMDYGSDRHVLNIKDQWMLGPSLMACPVGYYKARNRSVYFPRQKNWYDLYTGEMIHGGQKLIVDAPYEQIPVFVPEGSIIPFGPEMEWSDEKPAELINLYIYAGSDGSFQLYEDEGVNYNYERGQYATTDITYDDASRTVTIGTRKGQFPGMLKQRRFNIVLVSEDAPKPLNHDNPEGIMVQYNGKEIHVSL